MCEPACTCGIDDVIAKAANQKVLFSGGYQHQRGCLKGEWMIFQVRSYRTRQKQLLWLNSKHAPTS